MIDLKISMKTILVIVMLGTLGRISFATVYFGYGHVGGGGKHGLISYQDFSSQGRFFADSDYGFSSNGEDRLTAAKLGLKVSSMLTLWNTRPYVLGQSQRPDNHPKFGIPWLSAGGDCTFGLSFEAPLQPTWYFDSEHQFDRMPDKLPLFNRAVVDWGRLVPKPGTWGLCVLDADGKYKTIHVDNKQKLYPFDQSIITFPPTTVKTLYFGIKDKSKDNFVEVRQISLLLYNEALLDNHLLIDQPDAYRAVYSAASPGADKNSRYDVASENLNKNFTIQINSTGTPGVIDALRVENYYFGRWGNMLTGLSPFVELNGKRIYADRRAYPVTVQTKGRTETLRYQLRFAAATVDITTVFGVDPEDTIKFRFSASGLPEGARLGFEMFGGADFFANQLDDGTMPVEFESKGQTFQTPAGTFGIALDGAANFVLTRRGELAEFRILAAVNDLAVSLSLPIGPKSGVQSEMVNYQWRPSLADQGDPGVAPFEMKDLELLETIDLGDPKDSHAVFDITNDPLILNWRKSGETKLPRTFGNLKNIKEPEKCKVPLTTVLGKKCRVIGRVPSTYFRFNLNTRFEPRMPYLIVVEHAFDQERRGEFHCLALNCDGTAWNADGSMWTNPCPYGGFDTGTGPWQGRFLQESVFFFRPGPEACSPSTMLSLCFSNDGRNNYFRNHDKLPEGLAVKSVRVYRVTHLPELPDLEALLPEKPRRHVTAHSENSNPWMLYQFPRLYGYDSLWTHFQPVSQFLHGDNYTIFRPGWQNWCHPGTLLGERWLYEAAASYHIAVDINLGWLLDLGLEGSGHDSFLGIGLVPGDWGTMMGGLPLAPDSKELKLIETAIDRSLSALAPYPSFKDIAINNFPVFSKRNLDDFSKDTGISFVSSPAPLENIKRLLDSPRSTVDAWSKWACQKNYVFLSWLLEKARSHRSDIYLTINQFWYINGLQALYYGNKWPFNVAGFKAKGIDSYAKFLKFMSIDPALYSKGDGFAFGMEMNPISGMSNAQGEKGFWPFEGSGPLIRDSFGGGLSVSAGSFDEGPKPMQAWGCTYMKSRRNFRKDFVEALVNGNAREYVFQTYSIDPGRGRLADLRDLAVPFRLLPFAKPEAYTGKLVDDVKQARINKYGNRYCLANVGDLPCTATLTLPDGAENIVDLSNGIRQSLKVENGSVVFHLPAWSIKTLEIK